MKRKQLKKIESKEINNDDGQNKIKREIII